MKLYQYDDLKKANQALGSFKRNKIDVVEVNQLVVEGKVVHFILTDSEFNEDADNKENGKAEKKTAEKKIKGAARVKATGKGEASSDSEAKPAEATAEPKK